MKKGLIYSVIILVLLCSVSYCLEPPQWQTARLRDIDPESVKTIRDIVGEGAYAKYMDLQDPFANEGWSIRKYLLGDVQSEITFAHPEILDRLEPVYLMAVPDEVGKRITAGRKSVHVSDIYTGIPDYLMGLYRNDEYYRSQIYSYNMDIDRSRLVEVSQTYETKDDGLLYYRYKGSNYICEIDKEIEKVVRKLPVIQKAVLHGRFECILYDASRYGARYYQPCFLTVVKDNGRIIWYDSSSELGDVAITDDGRYMISTVEGEFYVTVTGDRIIAESYTPFSRGYMNSLQVGKWHLMPVSCRILTDNIVRLEYEDGYIQHWRVRLSDEDMEKNTVKRNKIYESKGQEPPKSNAAQMHTIWSNGKGNEDGFARSYKGLRIMKAWDYHESEVEPVYEDMIDMSKMKDAEVSDVIPVALVADPVVASSGDKTGKGDPGLLARLIARVKGFFAGLLA
ncbi:MAG: hypothetical protein IK083_03980 [Abditibacteriota bacterium]|nr:hypothetical protein [Abditibacteriota bacterium]